MARWVTFQGYSPLADLHASWQVVVLWLSCLCVCWWCFHPSSCILGRFWGRSTVQNGQPTRMKCETQSKTKYYFHTRSSEEYGGWDRTCTFNFFICQDSGHISNLYGRIKICQDEFLICPDTKICYDELSLEHVQPENLQNGPSRQFTKTHFNLSGQNIINIETIEKPASQCIMDMQWRIGKSNRKKSWFSQWRKWRSSDTQNNGVSWLGISFGLVTR